MVNTHSQLQRGNIGMENVNGRNKNRYESNMVRPKEMNGARQNLRGEGTCAHVDLGSQYGPIGYARSAADIILEKPSAYASYKGDKCCMSSQ